MRVHYEITLKDCDNFAKETIFMKRFLIRFIKDNVNRALIFSVIMTFCFGVYFKLNIVGFFLLFVFMLLIVYFIWLLKAYFEDGKSMYKLFEGLDKKYELVIEGNESIKRISNGMENSFAWENVKEIYNTKSNILIFVSERQALIIPKRAFDDRNQLDDFWKEIQDKYNYVTNK